MHENWAVPFYSEKQSLLKSEGKTPCCFDAALLPNVFEWLRSGVQETIEPGTSYFDQNTEKRS